MFNKLYAIGVNTFIETVRQPIYGILLWVAVGLLILNPSLATFSLQSGADNKIMKDVGLSTMMLFGLFAAVFSASGVIAREIESFTVLTVISKPVSRPTFLVGKFIGVVAAVAVAYYLLSLVFLMTCRHGVLETVSDPYDQPVLVFGALAIGVSVVFAAFCNFMYGWHFASTLLAAVIPLGTLAFGATLFFDKGWKSQPWGSKDFGDMQVIYAIVLTFVSVMILTAFAVTFSTRFSLTLTLLFCASVFMLGLLSDYYFGRNTEHLALFSVLYAAVPNFQFFWLGDYITQDVTVTLQHVLNVLAYGSLYTLAVLGLGITMFQTREVG